MIPLMKRSTLLIPLIITIVAAAGSSVTIANMEWYDTVVLPTIAPDGSVISKVWMTIYALTCISAVMVWNSRDTMRAKRIMVFFGVNAFLVVAWSFLFFGHHAFLMATIEAAILTATVFLLIGMIWPVSKIASLLLVPYALWVTFATYLNYVIWTVN